eukprot:PITA_11408
MATRRLLCKPFQEQQWLHIVRNALYGSCPAQCAEPVKVQRFDPWSLPRRGVVVPAQSHASTPVIHGDRWRQDLQNLNKAARERPLLEVTRPSESSISISPEERRRLLRFLQIDSLRKSLRQIPHACISRKELLQICMDSAGQEGAKEIAKSLDESGEILIIGDRVYLRPEQVARAVEAVVPLIDDRRREELHEMEKQKAEIDLKAKKLVHRELQCGFGFLSLQTAALMRFTFWDLSWDVMEPICFYLTSIYFLAGYAFFLRTSTDPTFEGFFQARFKTKQKRLMKQRNFDIERYRELRTIAGPRFWQSACGGLLDAI